MLALQSMVIVAESGGCLIVVVGFVVLSVALLGFFGSSGSGSGAPREPRFRTETLSDSRRELPGPPFAATVRYGTRRDREGRFHFTEFMCDMPETRARLVVATPQWAGQTRAHPNMTPFDVARWPYAVTTNEAAFASEALDFPMRRLIESLDVLHAGPLLVDLRPGMLIIRAEGRLAEAARLDAFIARSFEVAQRLRQGHGNVLVTQTAVSTDASCRVCGCLLEGLATLCAKCRTPHHADCWEYNGGCSVYACGGRDAE